MPLNEADTRAKLIDPAIHTRGWTEDYIKREVSAGSIEIIEGKAHRRAKGRVDYTLRIRVTAESQPVAVALIEAKAERLPAGHGLEQAKLKCSLNVRTITETINRFCKSSTEFIGKKRWARYVIA